MCFNMLEITICKQLNLWHEFDLDMRLKRCWKIANDTSYHTILNDTDINKYVTVQYATIINKSYWLHFLFVDQGSKFKEPRLCHCQPVTQYEVHIKITMEHNFSAVFDLRTLIVYLYTTAYVQCIRLSRFSS